MTHVTYQVQTLLVSSTSIIPNVQERPLADAGWHVKGGKLSSTIEGGSPWSPFHWQCRQFRYNSTHTNSGASDSLKGVQDGLLIASSNSSMDRVIRCAYSSKQSALLHKPERLRQ